MKKLFLPFLILSAITLVNAQEITQKTYNSIKGAFIMQYPSNWTLDDTETSDYLIKFNTSSDGAKMFVKQTVLANPTDAKTIVTKYIEPAWTKQGSDFIPLTESQRLMTQSQLEIKNIDSGYSTIIKTPKADAMLYTGYFVMTKGAKVYEVKYEAYGNIPQELIKLLPKVALSFRAL